MATPSKLRIILVSIAASFTLMGFGVIPQVAHATPPPNADEAKNNYFVRVAGPSEMAVQIAFEKSRGNAVGLQIAGAVNGYVSNMTPAQADVLSQSPGVISVELDAPVYASDTQTSPTWGIDRIDQASLPLSSSYTYPASAALGVKTYVIDTGVLTAHNEFSGRAIAGWSAIAPSTNYQDCNGHGTHVAGTIAGSTYGVAKKATIVPVRVLDCYGSGTVSTVVAGINWAIGNHQPGEPAVANMSLGGGISSSIDDATVALVNDGVTVVVAAGNSATSACTSSPARVPEVITVAASDSADRQASFSNYGTCVDLYAPGVSITSAWNTSTTSQSTLSGTSMASPHTAGVAALLLGEQPTLIPAQTSNSLVSNAVSGKVVNAITGTPNRLLSSSFLISATPPQTTQKPQPPTNVQGAALSGNKAKVTWVQGSNGGSPLLSQTVKIWSAGKLITSLKALASSTSITVSNLQQGKRYNFTVSATNSLGDSPDSAISNSIVAVR